MNSPALSARAISKTVRLPNGEDLTLFTELDVEVQPGTSLAVVGRSGSGKTSLLSILGLLGSPDTGSIEIGGRSVSHLTDRERARLRNTSLGFVFQSYSLVAHMSARRNIELPLLQGDYLGRKARRSSVDAAMDLAQISHRADSYPIQLSGGEQQRVAIARALVRNPVVIVADEPTGALDNRTADTVLGVLTAAATERGSALILATHDSAVAARAMSVMTLGEGESVGRPGQRQA